MLSLRMLKGLVTKDDLKKTYEGWKLLLAVDPDQVEAAKKCILPLLRPYGCYHTWLMSTQSQPFTIISLKRVGLEISRFAQPEIYVTPSDAKIMVRQIEEKLVNHKIQPGDTGLPGFTQTRSPYFYLANVNFTHPLLSLSTEYKNLLEKQGGFNPLNMTNPYQDLLGGKLDFDLVKHFSALPFENKEEVLSNLQLSLLGFLREHTILDELNEQEQEEFTRQCLKKNDRLSGKFIKSHDLAEQEIKTARMLFEWTLSPGVQEMTFNSIEFPVSDLFSQLIEKYNQSLRTLLGPNDVSAPPVVLEDFLQSKRENLAEHWMLAECGVFKENDEAMPYKIKARLPEIIRRNDYDELRVAMKKLKEVADIDFYHATLLALNKYPLVQVELAELLINDYSKLKYERPLTYKGLTFLKEAIEHANPETEYAIAKKVDKLWKSLDKYEAGGGLFAKPQKGRDLLIIMLKELARGGCLLAKFIMARFLCRDLDRNEEDAAESNSKSNMADHKQAQDYFFEVIGAKTVSANVKSLCIDYLNRLEKLYNPEKVEQGMGLRRGI